MSSLKKIKLSDVKEKFKCFLCNKILKDPVQLPCETFICLEHTKCLKSNMFECKSCLKEHIVHRKGFYQDIDLQKQIDLDICLTTNEKEHKLSVNSLFEEICELFTDFDIKFNEFEYFNHEYFAELEARVEKSLKYKLTRFRKR